METVYVALIALFFGICIGIVRRVIFRAPGAQQGVALPIIIGAVVGVGFQANIITIIIGAVLSWFSFTVYRVLFPG